MSLQTTIIGVDCATKAKRIGLAVATWDGGKPAIEQVIAGSECDHIAEWIAEQVTGAERALIALDAPLGWPVALGEMLQGHQAGARLLSPPDAMFRRDTDRDVRRRLGKQSLDVGADRIARTAHAALTLLDEVRRTSGELIPLAWAPDFRSRVAAIEVYPAATLKALGCIDRGYKGKGDSATREALLVELGAYAGGTERLRCRGISDDLVDAVVCTIAAADFLSGRVPAPVVSERVRREGWIWVRDP